MISTLRGLRIVAAIMVSTSCAQQQVLTLDMDYRAPPKQAHVSLSCDPGFQIHDLRRSNISYYKKIRSEELLAWVEAALQHITDKNIEFVARSDSPDQLDVYVEHAYVKPIATSKAAVVVLRLRLHEKDYTFRGNFTSISMWGSENEYVEALNRALSQAATQMLEEFQQHC